MEVFAVEVQKALVNRWFVLSLCFAALLSMLSAFGAVFLYLETEQRMVEWWGLVSPFLSASTCFRFFMVADYSQAATDLFYALLPLIAVMPYSWSLCQERKTCYLQNALVKTTRNRYLAGKAFAAALSGGLVVFFSLALNCVLCACFIPAYAPDVSSVFQTGIYDSVMGSELYYNDPVAFTALYLFLSFVFSALWAGFVLLLGGLAEDSTRLLAGSFLVLYLFSSFEDKMGILLFGSGTEYISISPLVWLRGVSIQGATEPWVPVLWVGVLVALSLSLLVRYGKEDVL